MSKQTPTPEFGKLRSLLWPIHNFELKKMVPMFFMFFCISFIYTILRDAKDSLIMTAPGSGAEAIPFLKVWCVVPSATILMMIFMKLSNVLSRENLFYATIVPFLIFFGLFGFVFYPLRDVLHPSTSADYLLSILPSSAAFKGIVAIYRNWSFAIFYILAEMWGSMVLSLLFWGFANDITKTSEAKRFYGMLGIGANIALIFSGRAIRWAAQEGMANFEGPLKALMSMTVVGGLLIIATYYWMQRSVLTDPRFYDASQVKRKKSKLKLGIKESVKYLARSKYLGALTLLVIAYGISINLIEVIWKGQVKAMYQNASDYTNFMGYFSEMTGYVTLFMFFFVSHNVIRKFGWKTAAMVTPVVLAITGVLFLNFIVFRDFLMGFLVTFGTSPLALAVIFGAAQNILSKSSKYSLFDPTKEMAYIPLDEESKLKGKAAIDVIGARLGKSGGSFIMQFLLFFLPTVTAAAPYVGIFFFATIAIWMMAVVALSKRYEAIVIDQDALAVAEANEAKRKIDSGLLKETPAQRT